MKNYIIIFPKDERGVFSTLWLDGDEVLAIRLRELLLRMDEVNTECFGLIVKKIYAKNPESLSPLWDVLGVRRDERIILWKNYLEENGPLPKPIFVYSLADAIAWLLPNSLRQLSRNLLFLMCVIADADSHNGK